MSYIQTHDLTFAYNGTDVIKGVDLSAERGEILAIIGPNGAGKTTLLKLLAGIIRPRKGIVLLGGHDIRRVPPRSRARMVGLVPQSESNAWPITVEQMVALGRAPHRGWLMPLTSRDRTIIEEVLGITGLDTLRDRPVTALSGGERQLALIARALAQQPGVLLLDEPTAHLDLRHQSEVMGLLRRLAHREGLAVVMTSHDVNQAAMYADRMALLAEGEIKAAGTPRRVLRPELLADVYGVQVAVGSHPVRDTPLVVPVPAS